MGRGPCHRWVTGEWTPGPHPGPLSVRPRRVGDAHPAWLPLWSWGSETAGPCEVVPRPQSRASAPLPARVLQPSGLSLPCSRGPLGTTSHPSAACGPLATPACSPSPAGPPGQLHDPPHPAHSAWEQEANSGPSATPFSSLPTGGAAPTLGHAAGVEHTPQPHLPGHVSGSPVPGVGAREARHSCPGHCHRRVPGARPGPPAGGQYSGHLG